MKKLWSRLILLALVLAMAAMLPLGALAEVRTDGVKKIAIETKPDKTVYMIGETFDPAGGELKVTYSDKSTAMVPLTDESVGFSDNVFTSGGKKSVTVKFGGKTARLSVTVSDAGYTVSYDTGCDLAVEPATVVGGATAAQPEVSREGFELLGWYTDGDFRTAFDFASPVNGDMTLYACWLPVGAEKAAVTFDYDYYGDLLTAYTRTVAQGEPVSCPADPARVGYTFAGWQLDGAAYDFAQPVSGDMTLTAVWTKNSTEPQTYVFEAEDTDLTGKEGVSSSGASTEKAMIQFDITGKLGASNDRWVAYLYKPNLSIDYMIACDMDTDDAVIELSFASELPGTYELSPENYTLELNGAALDFAPFTISNNGAGVMAGRFDFTTTLLVEGAPLRKGANSLRLYPSNNTTINGTTYQAVGPMIDCVKITTTAVLTWDAVKGLPANNY